MENTETQLVDKYPEIFQTTKYIGVGAGWYHIIDSLCANIQQRINSRLTTEYPVPQVVVLQIKEKFGGLRFYYNGGDNVVDGMVQMAESWASHTCEVCGASGKARNDGWIKTLCDDHHLARVKAK